MSALEYQSKTAPPIHKQEWGALRYGRERAQ